MVELNDKDWVASFGVFASFRRYHNQLYFLSSIIVPSLVDIISNRELPEASAGLKLNRYHCSCHLPPT